MAKIQIPVDIKKGIIAHLPPKIMHKNINTEIIGLHRTSMGAIRIVITIPTINSNIFAASL